jgi:hypothetical protein
MIEVKLNGELKQLKFGNYALEAYTKLTGADIGSIKEIGDGYSELDMIVDVTYSGLVGYVRSKGLILDFTINDVRLWVDELDVKSQAEIIASFYQSILAKTEGLLKQLEAMRGAEAEKKN